MSILITENLKKYYDTGEVTVKALDGDRPCCGKRRISGSGWNIGERKVHALTHAGGIGHSYFRQSNCGGK